MLPGQDFSGLVGELATGVARMGLSWRMAALFRKAAAYANTRKKSIVRQQASIAAHCLNNYVNWLGFDPLTRTESERSIVVQTQEGSVLSFLQCLFLVLCSNLEINSTGMR